MHEFLFDLLSELPQIAVEMLVEQTAKPSPRRHPTSPEDGAQAEVSEQPGDR